MRVVAAFWSVIAVLLAVGQFAGGDTAVLCGWLFLVWTAPIGIIWWFDVYNYLIPFAPKLLLQYTGTGLTVAGAYVFWFILVRGLLAWGRSVGRSRAP